MRTKVSSGIRWWIPALALLMLPVLAGCSSGGTDGLVVGDPAPDFSLPEAYGSTVSLGDYAGTATLLYFHMADG